RRRARARLRAGQATAVDRNRLGRAAARRGPTARRVDRCRAARPGLGQAAAGRATQRAGVQSADAGPPGRARQIAGLRMAYERRTTLPMRLAITVVVRAPDRATLERRTKRLQ